jgi:hypothetical protein
MLQHLHIVYNFLRSIGVKPRYHNFTGLILHIVKYSEKTDLRGLSPRENYTDRPSDRRLLAKLVPTFKDRGRHVVSVSDPYGSILDRSRYFFFQVALQLYSRG